MESEPQYFLDCDWVIGFYMSLMGFDSVVILGSNVTTNVGINMTPNVDIDMTSNVGINMPFVVCYMLCASCCLLVGIRYMLFAVCYLLLAICHFWRRNPKSICINGTPAFRKGIMCL